jgi:hypothetical protein
LLKQKYLMALDASQVCSCPHRGKEYPPTLPLEYYLDDLLQASNERSEYRRQAIVDGADSGVTSVIATP